MSVRPITESEMRLANGTPFTSLFFIFGATQGLLMHLRFHGLTVQGSWFPTVASRITMPIFVLGGAVLGATLAF